MEENQPKTGKFALTFGLILGAVSVIFGVMLYSLDLHYERGFAVQSVNIALMIAAIFICVFQFKKANLGFLTISQALKLGAGVGLISAIIGLLYFFILSNFIEPGYMDKLFEIGKAQALESNPKLTVEQIDQGIEMQKKFAWMSYPIGLIFSVLLGLVFGFFAGLIFKKAKPAY